MIRILHFIRPEHPDRPPLTQRAMLLMTLSNLLMLIGAVLLLYVGGLYATAEYGRYAARGDTDVPAPQPISPSIDSENPAILPALGPAEPAPFVPVVLGNSAGSASDSSIVPVGGLPENGQLRSAVPAPVLTPIESTITRVIIPEIDVDSKVVSVGWDVKTLKGQQVAIWQVAEYAVGHHRGSANPGEGSNIVLAGHVGGYGKVFRDLVKLELGDQLTLYSAGKQYLYQVSEKVIVTEEGVSAEQQAANARYIAPTASEMITLITCWPATGKDRFTQRVIVRAIPVQPSSPDGPNAQ